METVGIEPTTLTLQGLVAVPWNMRPHKNKKPDSVKNRVKLHWHIFLYYHLIHVPIPVSMASASELSKQLRLDNMCIFVFISFYI